MAAGYGFGQLYESKFSPRQRQGWLLGLGSCSLLLFVVLRTKNLYGDPGLWTHQQTFLMSVLSFLNVTKYPASLLYLLAMLGSLFLLLYTVEVVPRWSADFLAVLGRVPLFFYVLHLYVIHLIAIVAVVVSGRPWTDMILTAEAFSEENLANYGYGLTTVYVLWILIIGITFPLCRKYQQYKSQHPEKYWLSYL